MNELGIIHHDKPTPYIFESLITLKIKFTFVKFVNDNRVSDFEDKKCMSDKMETSIDIVNSCLQKDIYSIGYDISGFDIIYEECVENEISTIVTLKFYEFNVELAEVVRALGNYNNNNIIMTIFFIGQEIEEYELLNHEVAEIEEDPEDFAEKCKTRNLETLSHRNRLLIL